MKKFDLNNLGVQELDAKEMITIEGGSWISRAFDNVTQALDDAYHWAQDTLGITLGNDGAHQ